MTRLWKRFLYAIEAFYDYKPWKWGEWLFATALFIVIIVNMYANFRVGIAYIIEDAGKIL